MGRTNKVKLERAIKRRRRVRGKIHGTDEMPRMTVSRSLKNMYVQIIDDNSQSTLLGLGTCSKAMAGRVDKKDTKVVVAKKLGQAVAELALEKGIKRVIFDRNVFRYHGRVKALAEGAREKGLKF